MNICYSKTSRKSTSTLQFNLNALGLILTSQQGVKHFGAAGGSIINISSIASTAAPANGSVYNATKAAVDAVTKSLAKELGLQLHIQRQSAVIEQAEILAGWRLYVTNAPTTKLTLPQAVSSYREEWLLERGFHRFKGVLYLPYRFISRTKTGLLA